MDKQVISFFFKFFNKILKSILLILVCPTYWWPMSAVSKSVGFFTEVMKGNNIASIAGTFSSDTFKNPDRLAANPYRSITLSSNVLYLPADTYFCNAAFTISFFVRLPGVDNFVFADFKDSSGSGVQFKINGANVEITTFALFIGTITDANKKISANIATPAPNKWYFIAVSYGGSGSSPSFYLADATAAVTLTAIATNPANGLFTTALSCNNMVQAVIGKDAADAGVPLNGRLNDFKIYNFALSIDQIQARYNAETGNFFKKTTF